MERTLVLLGAGASVDAGVPVSTELTKQIAQQLRDQRPGSDTMYALNVAISLMAAHDAARGGFAYAGIDVERLFSAIQMLGDREALEIAPFVTTWNQGLSGVAGRVELPRNFAKSISDAVAGSFSSSFERDFVAAVHAANGGYNGETFQRLEAEMIELLHDALHISDGASDYLAPLLNLPDQPLRIATLNYDRGVEQMAGRWGRTFTNGLSAWDGGFQWTWPESKDVQLLKLHGSLDWRTRKPNGILTPPYGDLAGPVPFYEVDEPSPAAAFARGTTLGVIFGQRGKVRSEGPFLAMLSAFDDWLRETDRLIVIGYSFRDDHINHLIRRRIAAGELRLTLIDPAMDSAGRSWQWDDASPFLGELFRSVAAKPKQRREGDRYVEEPQIKEQHRVFACGARDGLQSAIGNPPERQR